MGTDGSIAGGPAHPVGEINDPRWAKVIALERASQLFLNPQGQPLPAALLNADDTLCFSGAGGGVSRVSAGTRSGEMFRATTTIRIDGEGDILPIHFGPTFLGPRDEILTHGTAIDIVERQTDMPVEVYVPAPEGAVAVRLRVLGGWAPGKTPSRLTYRFGTCRLYRRTADAPALRMPITGER